MTGHEMPEAASRIRREVRELAEDVWSHPEPGLEERRACALQVRWLKEKGYAVTAPYAGMETGFLAECGRGGRVFAIASEYDALPEIGHGCGHNLICGAAMTAAGILEDRLRRNPVPGRVRIIGTPAEEGMGGKVRMLRNHCLDGVGAVMMVHPSWRSTIDGGSLAIEHLDLEFHGKAAHAADAAESGANALDAMILFFDGVGLWRQQLPETSRIHGVIVHGGVVPNVIPDYTRACFYIRSRDDAFLAEMHRRFCRMAEGACQATGCTCRVSSGEFPCKARRPNAAMNQAYAEAMAEQGVAGETPERGGRGSSDFGDFSCACPGVHPYFAVSDHRIPGHSLEFRDAANTDLAYANMEKAGIAMARVAWRFLTEEEFRKQVEADFRG